MRLIKEKTDECHMWSGRGEILLKKINQKMDTDKFELNVLLKAAPGSTVKKELNEQEMAASPFDQFDAWFRTAFQTAPDHANAMVLSTVGEDLMPDARVVLLKDVSEGGFSFFSNYNSRKGKEIGFNPKASLLFFWPQLERQVRISGDIQRMSEKESDLYFDSRPFESKVGAWASSQSEVLKQRGDLEKRFCDLLNEYRNKPVLRPEYWGGYRLKPSRFEFWQGRESRLHDRIVYERSAEQSWKIGRLMP
jgi:pyridoxamine 5'-phosphate oxidase